MSESEDVRPRGFRIRELRNMLARFPNDQILGNPDLERRVMNLVWVVVPLQYYVFTRIAGGMEGDQWFSIALTVLMCFLFVLAVSAVIALIPSKESNYSTRLRSWSIALITNWAAAVSLLALSYFVSEIFELRFDLLQKFVCGPIFRCADYPKMLSIATYSIYLGYSLLSLAIVVCVVLFSTTKSNASPVGYPAPLTILVPLLTAGVLTILYSATKL
jgi:hypothetical protein